MSDLQPALRIGACYSNGHFGHRWQVRRIVAVDDTGVRYQVISGEGRRKEFTCSQAEFCSWIRYEVERDENIWRIRRDV